MNKIISILAIVLLTVGCTNTQPLKETFYEGHTKVIHAGNTVESIDKNCGKYRTYKEGRKTIRTRAMGCYKCNKGRTVCKIYAHTPTNQIEQDIWDHEIRHVREGRFHTTMRGKMTKQKKTFSTNF